VTIKFDISEIGNGEKIESAKLRLYKFGNFGDFNSPATYSVHTLNTEWKEINAGWNSPWNSSGGDFANKELDSFEYNGKFNGWFEFNVISAVQDMVDGKIKNYGFIVGVFDDNASLGQDSYFHSKESSKKDKRPQLVVEFGQTAIIPNTPDFKAAVISGVRVVGKLIQFSSSKMQGGNLIIHSVNGKQIVYMANIILNAGENFIDLSASLSTGLYVLKFKTENGTTVTEYVTLVQ
jgi:hypothetical protein